MFACSLCPCSRRRRGPAALLVRLPEEDPRPGLRGGLLGPEPLTAGQSRAAPPAEGGASAARGRPGEQAGEPDFLFLSKGSAKDDGNAMGRW